MNIEYWSKVGLGLAMWSYRMARNEALRAAG
jgi:hypothetical protein